jgi:hypothetical protein
LLTWLKTAVIQSLTYKQIYSFNSNDLCLQIAEEVLAMTISLTPEEIIKLAQQINQTIQGLQNIDAILNATSDDLSKAQKLKERAENAK